MRASFIANRRSGNREVYIVSGLHIEDLPDVFEELVQHFDESIREIKAKPNYDHHWSIEVVYDPEIFKQVVFLRKIKEKYV